MGVSIACGVVLTLALVLAVRWRDLDIEPIGAPPADAGALGRARHHLWWVQLVLLSGITAGVLVMGTGGRLAMRLLGATGGDTAQRQVTEAGEVVGEVTVSGTLSFVLFIGMFVGILTSIAWFALRRFLPARWVGGLAFGAGLLVVLGTRSDPLRPGNEDFDIVGPWWLAVLVFSALALAHGFTLAAFSARLSRWLPLVGRNRRSLSYASLALLVPAFPFAVLALVSGLLYVFGGDLLDRARRWSTGPTGRRVGQVVVLTAVVVAAPGFALAIGDLIGRGPG